MRRWTIYRHSSGNGFVPRECDVMGRAVDQYNYRQAVPVREHEDKPFVWKSYAACRKSADRMSGLGGFHSPACVSANDRSAREVCICEEGSHDAK